MKQYVNEFLRENISRVANGYKPREPDISWASGKEEKWKERLLNNILWIEPFLTKTNGKLFKQFKFSYTAQYIEGINGKINTYDSNWEWIKYRSNFTPSDASDVIKHYFVTQLILFLDISREGEPIIADFIRNIFDIIKRDREILNISEFSMQKWKDTIKEQRILAWARYFDAIKDEDALLFNAPYRKFTELAGNDPFTDQQESSEEFNRKIDEADKEAYLKDQAHEQLGEDASEQALESYVNDAISEDRIQSEVMEEVYNNPILKEGEEIMDIGTEYGQMPQGTETAGDGFNDYTMTEAWDPVHEPDVLGVEQ